MIDRIAALIAGALLAVATLAVAQSGGFPSRPTFQQVIVKAPVGRLYLTESDASANNGVWQHNVDAEGYGVYACNTPTSGCTRFQNVQRTGSVVDSIDLAATAVTVNGQNVCRADGTGCPAPAVVATSGTFTATFDNACTTSPTATFDYQAVGNIVVIAHVASSGFACTGDANAFATTGADIPVAIRPNANVLGYVSDDFMDNGALAWARISFNSNGTINFLECPLSMGADCVAATWTAAGNREIQAPGRHYTYMLGNP